MLSRQYMKVAWDFNNYKKKTPSVQFCEVI